MLSRAHYEPYLSAYGASPVGSFPARTDAPAKAHRCSAAGFGPMQAPLPLTRLPHEGIIRSRTPTMQAVQADTTTLAVDAIVNAGTVCHHEPHELHER